MSTNLVFSNGGFLEKTPSLIVTCRGTSIDHCIHEIGNVLYPKDPNVKINNTMFKGVLFVYTVLPPDRAYGITAHREYGFVENIIPIYCTLTYPLEERDIAECLSRLPLPSRIKLKVRVRGLRGVSEKIFNLAMATLKSMNIEHDTRAKTCLYFEGFYNVVYVGVGDCQSVFKAYVKSR
ncbi:MAG: RNA-binding protein [Desulfurococcaceae archaeon]